MAKDIVGNDLAVGDKVEFQVPPEFRGRLFGTVIDIKEGGISVIGGQRRGGDVQPLVTPGSVTVQFTIHDAFAPKGSQGGGAPGQAANLTKVYWPEPEAKAVKLTN